MCHVIVCTIVAKLAQRRALSASAWPVTTAQPGPPMATTAAHFQLTVTDADFTPVSQHKEKRKWKAIQEISSLQFQGGYTTKAEPAKTKLATGPDGDPVTLVHVAKREDWLVQ